MCGIVGFIDKKNKLSKNKGEEIIKAMIKSIRHRGKDSEGLLIENNLYLGHARLSIIDLSPSGHQPMISSSDKTTVVFNGEIYNFLKTKKLLQTSKKFHTDCDTEIILNAYEEWGLTKSLTAHKGMFAFGLLDKPKNLFHLAVDRFGIKPIYYIDNENFFAFSSEIKALFKIPKVKAELNHDCLEEYLIFRHLAGKNTLFKNIYKVLPANFLSINLSNYKIKQGEYWRLKKYHLQKKDHQKIILELINNSVKEHLIADVPVGLQLSGGVDSSLVASLAAKINKKNFHSFSIGLKDKNWNEFPYSQAVVKKIKSKHHQLLFSEKQFCSLLPKLTYHLDEPMDHSHSIPMYLLSKLARKKVKILLSGEGADEIFGGYKKYRKITPNTTNREIMDLTGFGDKNTLKKIVKINFKNKFPEREKILAEFAGYHPFDKLSALDQRVYLISMLMRQDKMGMAANIENRVPFLDHELVEAAFSLPVNEKYNGDETKLILKKIAEKFISRECIYREKVGFGQPISQWLRNSDGLGKYLNLFKTKKRKFIDYQELNKIIVEHKKGIKDHGQSLWILINLELWYRIFIDKVDYNKIYSKL